MLRRSRLRFAWRAALAATLIAEAAPAPAISSPALPSETDVWGRFETGGLTVFSDAPDQITRIVAANLANFRVALEQVASDGEPAVPIGPFYVYVFRDEEAYAAYRPVHEVHGVAAAVTRPPPVVGILPDEVAGAFSKDRDGSFIALDAFPFGDPWTTIQHESVHAYLHDRFTDVPLWLDEGLAQCFSTFRVVEGRGELGRQPVRLRRWLKGRPLLPISDLLLMDERSPDYHGGTARMTFYAESWALVHYLLWGAEGAPGSAFLRRLHRGQSLREAIWPLFGPDPGRLDERLRAYVRKNRYPVEETPVAVRVPPAEAPIAQMTRSESLARLGDYLLHIRPTRPGDAEGHFQEAARLDSGNAFAWAGLAAVRHAQERDEEANALFEKALTTSPSDAAISLRYAHALADQFQPHAAGVIRLVPPSPAVERARELFRTGLAAMPDSAEAWARLGATYLYVAGEATEGFEALQRARALLPGRETIAADLAALQARAGNRASVEELAPILRASRSPELRRMVDGLLFQADVAAARLLVGQGQVAEGRQRLLALRDAAPSPEWRSLVDEELLATESNRARPASPIAVPTAGDEQGGPDLPEDGGGSPR